jgi:hypothetical protein
LEGMYSLKRLSEMIWRIVGVHISEPWKKGSGCLTVPTSMILAA